MLSDTFPPLRETGGWEASRCSNKLLSSVFTLRHCSLTLVSPEDSVSRLRVLEKTMEIRHPWDGVGGGVSVVQSLCLPA